MPTTTVSDSLILFGKTTTSHVQSDTLETYTSNQDPDELRFGATSSYGRGYAIRGEWSKSYFANLPLAEISGMSIILTCSSAVSSNLRVHYGALASGDNSSGGAIITAASANTAWLEKSTKNFTIDIDANDIAVMKNSYGIGFGGTKARVAQGKAYTIQVQFTVNAYHVTYNKGAYGVGADILGSDVAYGQSFLVAGTSFTRSGYKQIGWSVNANGSTLDYPFGSHCVIYSNTTLYPYWQEMLNTSAFCSFFII